MSRFGLAWDVMKGKISQDIMSWWTGKNGIYGTEDPTVDYARNDYDLFRALYFASKYKGKGKDYIYAAAFAKPIVNSTSAFVMGSGVSVELTLRGGSDKDVEYDDDGNPKPKPYQDAEDDINRWLENNKNTLYDFTRHSYRDGDGYLYVDEMGALDELDAPTVTAILDTITGDTIGYDVVEVVEERTPQDPRPVTYRITKQYRTDSIKYFKAKENEKGLGTVIYSRVYTEDGIIEPTEGQMFLDDELITRPLPVIHYANEREPRQIYGNSDYQNLLALFKSYTLVLRGGTKGVIYNSTPIPVLKGVRDSNSVAKPDRNDARDRATEKRLPWGEDSIIYLNGDTSDAKFLQAGSIMGDVDTLLKKYFYLIVQGSETPEFVFGGAVNSSRASTETQLPVMTQKAERKRTQLQTVISDLVKSYIDRQVNLSNPDFTTLRDAELDIKVNFPDLIDEDKQLNLQVIQFLVQQNLIKDATALKVLMGDRIADPEKEIEDAKVENQERVDANNLIPEDNDRLDEEEGSTDEDKPTDTPTTKSDTTTQPTGSQKGVSNDGKATK